MSAYQPTGIKNFGNTCYANSTLQCLASCRSLYQALGERPHYHQRPEPECLSCEFQNTIVALNDDNDKDDLTKNQEISASVKRILGLVGAVSANNTGLDDQHEDAAEFLLKLFDGLQQQEQQKQEDHRGNNEPSFAHICQGKLSSSIKCLSCGKISEVLEPFEDLELEISSALSLRDALRAYTRKENLSSPNVYNCSTCKATTPAEKVLKIHALPEILRLQVCMYAFINVNMYVFIHVKQ